MPFERRIVAAISEGSQLFAHVDVLQSEGDPVQVPVRVDVRVLAHHILRHHGQGLDATDNQRGHQLPTERENHFAHLVHGDVAKL